MKSSLISSFRRRIIISTLLSGIIMIAVLALFSYCFRMVEMAMVNSQMRGPYISREGIDPTLRLIIFISLGVCLFIISFIRLMRNSMNYLKEILEGITKISSGDLSVVLPVRGNDEFTKIAMSINNMTEEIVTILNREREAEKSKNDLITSVAHDIRTPLTSIIGYLDLIRRKPDLTAETKSQYVEIAYNKSKRLESLANDLFGFTKLNHGQMTIEPGILNIVQLLSQLLDEFYPSIEKQDLECEFKYSDPNIYIDADGNLIARLFDNLISNAIKYGSDGKIIMVDIQKIENNRVRIRVINYGRVIEGRKLEHVFDKFYRVDPSRSAATGGTGLGLAIAKSIVEMHGGTIEARSDEHGTVFEVILYTDFKSQIKKFKE